MLYLIWQNIWLANKVLFASTTATGLWTIASICFQDYIYMQVFPWQNTIIIKLREFYLKSWQNLRQYTYCTEGVVKQVKDRNGYKKNHRIGQHPFMHEQLPTTMPCKYAFMHRCICCTRQYRLIVINMLVLYNVITYATKIYLDPQNKVD